MDIELGYGEGATLVRVPEKNLLAVLMPKSTGGTERERDPVEQALGSPIGSLPLCDIVHKGQKVAVVTSDITRPMPSHKVLPQVIAELYRGGVDKEDITAVFALGIHRAHSEKEMRALAGDEVFDSVKCVDSNPEQCVCLGETRDGTPVDIFVPVAEADVRVLLGNIEYHYFAGYSGGAKALLPGVSSRRAIGHNHRNMVLQSARAGSLEGNPVRKDIDSVLDFLSADFIVNVVLDEHKNIVHCVAGDAMKAHRVGCDFLDALCAVPIGARADCVIVSAGGEPKDMNAYQAQKALDNAKLAVKRGGTILWVAQCREGFGESVFKDWLTRYPDPATCVSDIQKHFELGGHKAAAIANTALWANIMLVSDMSEAETAMLYCKKAGSAQEALDEVLKNTPDATVIAMPYGGSTLPKCED